MSNTAEIDTIAAGLAALRVRISKNGDEDGRALTEMLGGIETALTEIAEALSADNSAGMAGVARAIAGLKLAIPAAQMTLPPMQVTLPPMQVLLPQQTPPAIHVEAVKQWSKISVTAKKESRTGLVTSYLIERIS